MAVWWTQGAEGIRHGLMYYADATGSIEAEYDGIEVRAKSRFPHCLDARDLTTVVQFKLWPGIRRWAGEKVMADASPEQVTARAFQQALDGDVYAALLTLDQLPRVGIPTASAILAAAYPERFAVIDRYVMSEVGYLATTAMRDGQTGDESLALLIESLTAWAVEPGGRAYLPFIAGVRLKAEIIRRSEGEAFRPRDIEKATFGHFLKRTGRRVP